MQRLADLGAAIVWPFERAFSALARKVVRAAEGVEGIESVFIRIGWALLWPVRMVWRGVTAAATAIVPESARQALSAPLRGMAWLGRAFRKAFMRVAEALNLDGLVLWIVRHTRYVWYPFAALWGFFHAWLATRSYKQLVWGLPVAAVLVTLAGIAVWMNFRGRSSVAKQYRQAVTVARAEKDYDRVRLYERKLAQLGVSTQFTDYQTAFALAEDGQLAEAYARMQRLAPADEPGYPPAHSWIIQQLMAGKLDVTADESHRLIKVHLDHLDSLGARGPDFDLRRAFWLVRDNRAEEAADLLAPIASRLLPAAVLRMEINQVVARYDEARSDARIVRTHMQDRARREETLSAQDYQAWAVAEELLGDTAKAHSLTRERLKLEPENGDARRVLSGLSARLFERELAIPNPVANRLTALLLQSASFSGDQQRVQRQVGELYRLRDREPAAQQAVDQLVGSSQAPATLWEAMGTVAATFGEHEEAKRLLLLAVKKDPNAAVAWNNYAWLVVQEPQGDMAAALEAVNKALAIQPDEFRFRETRGQIWLRLGKWNEAVEDLEYAANGMPDSREVHLSLAKAYDALGQAHLARVHREHAQ